MLQCGVVFATSSGGFGPQHSQMSFTGRIFVLGSVVREGFKSPPFTSNQSLRHMQESQILVLLPFVCMYVHMYFPVRMDVHIALYSRS